MHLQTALLSLLFVSFTVADDPTPVVLWHGMGDSCCSKNSMGWIMDILRENIPGVYIYSIALADTAIIDREKSFLANMNDEVAKICDKIASDKSLANGYNAIGFSQGGQFLRAIAQRCPSPPMKRLITLGGQHQGVYGFPNCYGDTALCDLMRQLLDLGAYIDFVQNELVQAQYFHDSDDEELYRDKSIFLADINNEKVQNDAYKTNLANLEHLVLVKFTEDTMVVPRDSSWFGFYKEKDIDTIMQYNETSLYIDDRIGLKTLDESGRLHFMTMEGEHLQIDENVFIEIIDTYLK